MKFVKYNYKFLSNYIIVELQRTEESKITNEETNEVTYVTKKKKIYIPNLLDDISLKGNIFSLEVIVHHDGEDTNHGHYYTHRYINDEWYFFDDSTATQKSLRQIQQFLKHKDEKYTPCMLLYKKKQSSTDTNNQQEL